MLYVFLLRDFEIKERKERKNLREIKTFQTIFFI